MDSLSRHTPSRTETMMLASNVSRKRMKKMG
jgi:hypothetical protein